MADRFVAMEKFAKVASAAEGTANAVVFSCPLYAPVGMIPTVLKVTSGALYVTGVTCLYDATAKTITVAGTDITEGDKVSVLAFA